ncbi:hypothetical protein D3H65_13100 [Paraflavitalea soli]|uniref:T9SS C-terminal target domain-containing protein n=1 Tax=Paraflavitalea soli TaxID=2315862 RepID=A0A3B7MTA2_9BACT|nr:hypothetical protein [Paraflavitalea soli]AXY74865.1 hypothetical protein D3H65_13100 [Paraflavitalea soli]
MRPLLSAILLYLATTFQTMGQCVPPVPPPVIACGTGTPLADGVSINAGQTYFFNGVGGSFSNITVNGGTLLLCGSVTITNVNVNSGTVVINAGASVTFNGNFNAGTNNFFNAGTVVFNLNVAVQGTNTFVYNASTGSITINGTLAVFNSGLFINNGTAIANDILINSGASICLGPNSTSHTASITNNQTNVVTVPTGTACVSYSNSFTGNNPITATSSLKICQMPGASAPVPAVPGAAIITANCTSCSSLLSVLPLKLLSFKGRYTTEQAYLEWTTTWEEHLRSFIIEHSENGQAFNSIGEVKAHNQPSTYTFTSPIHGDGYYRLKMVDIDGRFTLSSVVRLKATTTGLQLTILSNPVTQSYAEVSIAVAKSQLGYLVIIDNMGRPVKKTPVSLTTGTNNFRPDLNGMGAGNYFLYFEGKLDKTSPVRLVKL